MDTIDESQLNLADLGAQIGGWLTTDRQGTRNEKWGTRNEKRETRTESRETRNVKYDRRHTRYGRQETRRFYVYVFWTPEGKVLLFDRYWEGPSVWSGLHFGPPDGRWSMYICIWDPQREGPIVSKKKRTKVTHEVCISCSLLWVYQKQSKETDKSYARNIYFSFSLTSVPKTVKRKE